MVTALFNLQLGSLGFLRLSLLALATINTLVSVIGLILDSLSNVATTTSLWQIISSLVAPVMAPIFIVVIFLDYIMVRVKASDAGDDSSQYFLAISRIELLILGAMMAYWIPFLMSFGR